MSIHFKDPPTSAVEVRRSDEEHGIKVVIRCDLCTAVMAIAYVPPKDGPKAGHVFIGRPSIFDSGGIENAPGDGFRFQCPQSGCDSAAFTVGAFDLAKLAEARASQPKRGNGRSIEIGPRTPF